MKLRLPHKFQAALMAALASVSFTTLSTGTIAVATGAVLLAGQQASAENADQINAALTTQIQQSGYVLGDKYSLSITLGANPVSALGNNGVGVLLDTGGVKLFLQKNNSAPKWGHFGMGTDTLVAGSSTTIAPTSVAGDLAGKQAVATWNLESAQTDGAWLNRYLTSSTDSYTVGGRKEFNVESATVGVAYDGKDTTLTFTMNGSNGPDNGVPGTYKIVLADTDLNASGITFGTGCSNYTLSTLSFTATHEFSVYTWAGTEDSRNWNGANWTKGGESGQQFGNGSDAVFDSIGYEQVAITSAVSARNVTVGDQNYTFTLSGDGSLTATKLTVTSGLAITGSGTATAGTLDIASGKTVSIESGAKLTVDSRTGSGKISGDGTFQLNQAAKGDVTINAENFTGTFIFNEGNVSQHDTSIKADAGFAGTLEIRGRIRTDGTDLGNAQGIRFVADRSSNATGVWSNTAVTWDKPIEISKATPEVSGAVVQFELSNTMTLTGALSGNGTLMTTNNSTLNIQGGGSLDTLYAKGGNSNAQVNITGKELTLNHLFAGGSTTNIGTTVNTGQLRLSENGSNGVVVSVNNGGTLNITGTNNDHSTSASMLLAHWNQTSTLRLNGGTINAADTEMHLSWDGTGTFAANSGTAYIKGIDGYGQTARRGTFSLGSADSGSATVVLGSTGLKNMGDSVVLTLGQGTLGAAANWTLSTDAGTAVNANFIGTGTGTTIDTSTYTITFNNGTTGSGNMTVAGTGKLVLNGGGNRTGATTVQGGATLEVHNAAALGTGAVTVDAGGTLDLQSAVTLGSLTLAAGADEADGGILKFCANDAPMTLSGNLTLGAGSVFDLDNIQYTSGDVTLATVSGEITGWENVKLINDHGQHGDSTLSVSGNTLLLTFAQPDTLLVWSNDEGNGAWSEYSLNWRNTAGTPVAYTQSSSVRFTAEMEDVAFVTAQNIEVDTLNIDSAATANIYTGSGKELSVASVEGAGATLSLTGEGSTTVSGETVLDALTVAGGSAALNGTATITALNAKGGAISFGSDATVGTVNVISGESTITGLGTITTLNATGGTATFSGTDGVATLNLQGNGTSVLHGTGAITTLNATGGTTTLDAGTAVTTLNATTGTSTVNGAISVTTLNATGGTIAIHGTDADHKASVNSVNVAQGATAEFTYTDFNFADPGNEQQLRGNVVIGTGAKGTNTRTTDAWWYGAGSDISVTVDGGELAMGSTRWTVHSHNKLILKNGAKVTGAGQGQDGALDFDGSGNVLEVTDGTADVAAAIRFRNNTTQLKVADQAVLTLSGTLNGSGSIEKTGLGELVISSNVGYSGSTIVSAGTLTVSSAYNLTSDNQLQVQSGATANFTSAVTVGDAVTFSLADGAALNFNGSVAVTRAALDYDETVRVRTEGNGFGQTIAYTNIGEGLGGSATWTLNGNEATYHADTGRLDYASNAATYYIFTPETIADVMAQTPTKIVVDVLAGNIQDLGGTSLDLHDLVIESGVASTTYAATAGGQNGCVAGNITINGGGTFRVEGGHDAFSWGDGATKGIIMAGEAGNLATLELNQNTGNSVTMKTDITMHGYSTITTTKEGGSAGFNKYGGTITVDGLANNIDVLDTRSNGATINVVEGGELTIGKITTMASDNSPSTKLTKAGAGNLILTGVATTRVLDITAGLLTQANTGSLTLDRLIVSGGSTATFNGAVTVNSNGFSGNDQRISITGGSTVYFNGSLTYNGPNDYALVAQGANTVVHFSGENTLTKSIGQDGDATIVVDQGATLTTAGMYNSSTLSSNGAVRLETGAALNTGILRSVNLTNAGTINATGEVKVAAMSGTGSINATAGLVYESEADGAYAGNISASTLTKKGAGTLALSGVTTVTGATTLNGTLVMNTADNTVSTLGGAVSGAGSLTKTGAGTLNLSGDSSFSGSVLVNGGTVALGNGNGFGAQNNTVTIEAGATVDINGKDNRMYSYTLHGGSLVNNGNATDHNHTQNNSLTLTASSTVGGSGKMWMIAGSWGATTANLNGHTLTKEGTGTFSFVNTDISAGTIAVKQGTVEFYNQSADKISRVQADIELDGGTISGVYKYTASETAVTRNLTVNQSAVAGAAITIGNNVTMNANVAANQVLTLGGAITGTGNFSLSGEGTLALGSSITTTGTVSVAADAGITFANGATISANTFNLGSGSRLDFSDYKGTVGSEIHVVTTASGVTGYAGADITGPVAPRGMTATVAQEDKDIVLTFQAKSDATMHLYVLTGQSNSLGAVKDSPLNATMLAAYQSEGLLWNGNMNKDSGVRFETDPTWQVVAPQKPDGSGYNNNPCMGPEYGFSYIMENNGWATQLLGENDTLAVVKGSLDGGGNGYWLQDANAYQSLLGSVKESIQDAVALGYTNISLDGLMYLQGESNSAQEANLAATRFTDFVGYLKSDLQSWLAENPELTGITLSFDSNTVTGEPRLGNDARQKTETQLLELATSNNMINADQNGKGHVLTNDLAVTNCDGLNVHYTGNSQLTIGARYAYAFAVQNGIDVGAVRGQDDSKTLDQAGAWWMEKLPGADEVTTWDISSVSTVNEIAAGKTLTVGGIKIDEVYNKNATAKGQGSVAINGGAISLGQHGINLVGGDLSITSGVTVRESQTWQAAEGHKLAVNGTTTISDGATLTLADGLYLTFGAITGTGNLAIGTVTFDMDMDYMMANGLGKYMTSEGAGDNGFFTGKLDLVRLTGTNSTITFTGEDGSVEKNITKAGELASHNLELSEDGKALQITDLAPDAETYFTRKGEVVYTSDDAEQYGIYTAKQVMLSGSVENPATLTLASALKEGVTIQASGLGGTVNILNDVTLAATSVNAAGAPVAITGSGKLVGKTSGTVSGVTAVDAFGTGVTLSDEWTGTVRIANTTISDGQTGIKLNELGNENSVVEFEGVKAFLNADSYTYTPNIRLTGDGLNIDAGTSGKTYTFNGDVTGNGKLNLSLSRGSDNHTYVFAGDVEGWNGELLAPTNGRTLTVKFTGEADTVNAAIKRTGGTLHLVADADTAFNAALTGLNSFTVNGSKSASVLGGIGTNATTLNAGASLTIGGEQNSTLGTVTLNNNTALSIGGSGTVTASNVKVGDQCAATITLGNNFSMEQLDTIGANKTLAIASEQGVTKTLTTGKLGFDNVGTGISLQNVNMVVTGAATAGVLDAHSNNKGTMTVGAGATLDLQGTTAWNTSDTKYVDLVVKDGGAVSVTGGTENKVRNVELGTGGSNASLSFGVETHTAIANTNVAAGAHATVNGDADAVDFGNVNVGANAEMNVMNMGDAATVSVSDVTIGAGATMGVYTGADVSAVDEAALQIASGKTLTAAGEGATLNANLVMDSGSTLDVRGTNGAGLLMGSTVTLNTGMTLNDYSSDWSSWEDGTTYTLFTGVDGLDIGSGSGSTAAIDYTQWVDAKQYFENITESNRYFLCYEGAPAANAEGLLTGVGANGANVGMVYIMVMPEPTTGTLSLLALAALAARRRRK